MADLDLLSYERDSRWMPHLSWTYPDWTLQEKMAQQAAQREQAWQRISDKLGSLLVGSGPAVSAGVGGSTSSFGQSDFIVRDFEEHEYQERAYEKAPLLTTNIKIQRQNQTNHHNSLLLNHQKTRNSYQSLNSNNINSAKQNQSIINLNYNYDSIDSLRPSQSPIFSERRSHSSGVDVEYIEQHNKQQQQQIKKILKKHQQQHHYQNLYQAQQQYDHDSFKRARRRCWTVSGLLILLVILLFTLVTLMALGVIQYKTFPRLPV